jgi:sporulation protein YlmC with PRC-barrel domain
MRTLSSFLGRAVETESGHSLGKCRDLRASIGGGRPTVDAIIVGRRGWLEHLGIGKAGAHRRDKVLWKAVVKIEGARIIVRDGTELV